MAHMVPPNPPAGAAGAESERLLWDALHESLPDEYFVYSGLRYVDGERAQEGEADFLLLHRELGMLVIECKGYGVVRSATGEWFREGPDGTRERLRQEPFGQAQRQIKDLVRLLGPRVERAFPSLQQFPFVHGHAVAFPRALVGQVNLPLDAPRELVIDASDLGRMRERVDALFATWRKAAPRRPPPLDRPAFTKFRKRLLCPALRLVPGLGASLRGEEQQMHRLSQDQALLVEGWLSNRTLLVNGAAGTGKTVLALEAARQLSALGESVLLLCYTRFLGESFGAEVERWERGPGDAPVRACHFHALCHAAYAALGYRLKKPEDKAEATRFWDEEAPLVLLEALESGALPRYDALVVDEGQDFLPDWWSVLDDALSDRATARRFVFFDPSQDIYRHRVDSELTQATGRWKSAAAFGLHHNFRNTRRIAEVVQALGRVDARPHHRCPEGEPPDVRKQPGRAATCKQVDALIRQLCELERLQPEQLTILTPHSRKNSSLAGLTELGGVPLAGNPADRAGAVLHVSIGAFKGLESDVLILVDVDPKDDRCNRFARYVAASRAKHRLHVFAKGNWLAE